MDCVCALCSRARQQTIHDEHIAFNMCLRRETNDADDDDGVDDDENVDDVWECTVCLSVRDCKVRWPHPTVRRHRHDRQSALLSLSSEVHECQFVKRVQGVKYKNICIA